MYEDTPQDLVHDLVTEAVFGVAPARAAGNRLRGGHLDRLAPLGLRVPPSDLRPRQHRRRRRGERRARAPRRAARAGDASKRTNGDAPKRRVRSPLVKTPPPGVRFQRKDTEQYHVCLAAPGIARSDRRRFAASLLDAILGGSASSRFFQEIREKRGMAYSVYTFASQYTDTGQIGFYVGTREENLAGVPRDRGRRDRRHRRRQPARERARAREGEPEGPDHARDGIDRKPDEPARQVARSPTRSSSRSTGWARRSTRSTPEAVSELAGVLLAPERFSAAGSGRTRTGSWTRSST